jgi:hypothetical protein
VRVPYVAFQACMAFGGWFGYRFMAGLACKLAPSRRLAQHDAGVLVGCRTGLQGSGGAMSSHGQRAPSRTWKTRHEAAWRSFSPVFSSGLHGFSEINLAMVAKRDSDTRTKQRGDRAGEYTDGFLTLVRCSERGVVAAWERQQQRRCTAASCVDRQRREQNREQAASTSSAGEFCCRCDLTQAVVAAFDGRVRLLGKIGRVRQQGRLGLRALVWGGKTWISS